MAKASIKSRAATATAQEGKTSVKKGNVAKLGPISKAIAKAAHDRRVTNEAKPPKTVQKGVGFTGFTVKFELDHETKGAVRYTEVDNKGRPYKPLDRDAKIGTLYLRKSALNGAVPKRVTVTVG